MYSQLFYGLESCMTNNYFDKTRYLTSTSTKNIAYIKYSFGKYFAEGFYSIDEILTSNNQITFYNFFYEYGLLLGTNIVNEKYALFNAGLGIYRRTFDKRENIINDFGNKLGLTGIIQFGIPTHEGANTYFTMRSFKDIYNFSKEQNQLLLNQQSLSLTIEVNLTYFYKTKLLKKNRKRKKHTKHRK